MCAEAASLSLSPVYLFVSSPRFSLCLSFISVSPFPPPGLFDGRRAGRRGKDSQGSVVLMRSRFEDCIEAHRLLLSPMDGIQSQFK